MRILLALLCALSLASLGQAQEFKIPKGQVKELLGTWNVVEMGEPGALEPLPEGLHMSMTFKADGSGQQIKGNRIKEIVWGATNEGVFAAQWKQVDGKGDGIMGVWKMTHKGLLLKLQEFEDGIEPEDKFTLLMKKVDVGE